MPSFLLRPLAVAILLIGLPGRYSWLLSASGQTTPLTVEDEVYTYTEQMPTLPGGGGTEAIAAAVQDRLMLPADVPVPTNGRVEIQVIVGKKGGIESAHIAQSKGQAFDAAVLAAVHQLPLLSPGRQTGQPVRVALNLALNLSPAFAQTRLTPEATPDTAAQRRQAQTLKRSIQRRPGEADTTFLRRVLPVSCPQSSDLVAATWRPSAFGKQLFFSVRGQENNDGGTDLFMLDPFQANTYAVQVFAIPSQGDLTDLRAFFFADVDRDGQKELLAIGECSLRESFKVDGQVLTGRAPHYQTLVFQHAGLSNTGRPQYKNYPKDTAYLDELPTAAAVRQALARPQQRRKMSSGQPAAKAVKK